MTHRSDQHPSLGARPPVGMMRARLALALLALLALSAVAALASGASAAQQNPQGQASRSSHRGKCARRVRRRVRRHHHCSARRRDGAKAPAPALALTAPTGPTIQPVAPIVLAPPASAPPPPATSTPASEGAKGGEGGGQTGEGVEPPSIPHVQVSAVEYAFTLSRTTVPAGKVIFQFVNDGQDEHNLQIAPPEGPLVGSFADMPAKGISDLQLEMQAGQYKLFCSLPTHEQEGMKATLSVE
jgi:plastocyanin